MSEIINSVSESNEQQKEINEALCRLETKCMEKLAVDSYEKNEDGSYNAKINGITLDIKTYSPEKLEKILKLSYHIMSVYKESEYNSEDNPLYAKESSVSKGESSVNALIDLVVDNRIGDTFDTTMLTEEAFRNVFGENPRRGGVIVQKYADFLNSAIAAQSPRINVDERDPETMIASVN